MRDDDSDDINPVPGDLLSKLLLRLQPPYMRAHYHELAQTAAEQQWTPLDYFQRLIEGEVARREDKSLQRRIRLARFPILKTLDQFQWNWPKKINRPQIQNLFRLNFIEKKANAIFLGGVGLGKTHLCIALGHTACLRGYSVLFTTAIDIIHTLSAAAATGNLKRAMQRYLKPALVIVDEIGYLPIDKHGADLLLKDDRQLWQPLLWQAQVEAVLRAILNSSDAEARVHADRIADQLVSTKWESLCARSSIPRAYDVSRR